MRSIEGSVKILDSDICVMHSRPLPMQQRWLVAANIFLESAELPRSTGVQMKREGAAETSHHARSIKVMTVREVCAYLRVSRSTIHRLLKENHIPAFRVGGEWRFHIEAIDRWRLRQKPAE
jgi:excisionase family DNA binding protein